MKPEDLSTHRGVMSGYRHYFEQLKKRYNTEITFDEYVETCVKKRNSHFKPHQYVKYRCNDKVRVYFIDNKVQYPITIYPIDKKNKNRLYYLVNEEEF